MNLNLHRFFKGSLEADVNRAFDIAMDNILDERTEPGAVRKIVVEFALQPDAKRKNIKCITKVTPKIAGTMTGGMLKIGTVEGEVMMSDQLNLFDDEPEEDTIEQESPGFSKIVDMGTVDDVKPKAKRSRHAASAR